MNLDSICNDIFKETLEIASRTETPIAYVCVKVGKDFCFNDADLLEAFRKIKWDSPVSSADLVLEHDENLTSIYKIFEIRCFIDDMGREQIFRL